MFKLTSIATGLDLLDLDNNTTTFDSIEEAQEAQETFSGYIIEHV